MSSRPRPEARALAPLVSGLAPGVLRRFTIAMSLAAVVLAATVTSLYIQDRRHQEATLEREADHVLALKRSFLSQEFRAVRSDLLYLSGQEALHRFLSGEATVRAALERDYVRFVLAKTIYEQVRCLDLSGHELVRVNFREAEAEIVPRGELQSKASRYYFEEGSKLEPGEVFVSPFDLNVEHGKIQQPPNPVVRFVTPVLDRSGAKGGILVLNYLGAHLLGKLKEIGSGFRGENMLVNGQGEYLQASDPAVEWGWMRGHDRSFRADYPEVWRQCESLDSGQLRVGEDLFKIERVCLFRDAEAGSPASVGREASALLLISRIPAGVRSAHSSTLLGQLLLISSGTMLLVAILSLYWARSVSTRELQDRRLAESETRLRLLSSRLLAAQEDERRNLSRQLHDELGQLVTAIRLDVKSASQDAVGNHAATRLTRAIEEIDELLKSLHEIASHVRPCVLDDLGLRDAIESFVSEYEQRTGIIVRCDLRFHRHLLPPTVGENVYRIVQEALSNTAEHSQASEVDASIEVEANELRLFVEDSGVGFDPEASRETTRLGILGMRERVELLGGVFDLSSTPGAGTRIRVAIPLPPASEPE